MGEWGNSETFIVISCQNYEGGGGSPSSEMEQSVLGVLRTTRDLRQQLCATTMEQAGDLGQVTKAGQELVSTIRNLALANDINRLQESSDRFHEYMDHIIEASVSLRSSSDRLNLRANEASSVTIKCIRFRGPEYFRFSLNSKYWGLVILSPIEREPSLLYNVFTCMG